MVVEVAVVEEGVHLLSPILSPVQVPAVVVVEAVAPRRAREHR